MPRPIGDKLQEIKSFLTNVPRLAAGTALKFFDESWDNNGFTDKILTKWKPVMDRKSGKPKQRPLVETGRLRRSLRSEVKQNEVTIYTEVPYAQIHNEGGTIKGTQQVSEHYRTLKSGKRVKVHAHTRSVNHTMPKRQFAGPSHKLESEIQQAVEKGLDKILDNA